MFCENICLQNQFKIYNDNIYSSNLLAQKTLSHSFITIGDMFYRLDSKLPGERSMHDLGLYPSLWHIFMENL